MTYLAVRSAFGDVLRQGVASAVPLVKKVCDLSQGTRDEALSGTERGSAPLSGRGTGIVGKNDTRSVLRPRCYAARP
jgi:hypothetical protein